MAAMKMSIIVIVSIRSFFFPFATCCALQLLRPGVVITPPPKDGSEHMTFGRFAGIFACQGAADRERKKTVKTDGGSEVPLSSRSNNKQLDVRVV